MFMTNYLIHLAYARRYFNLLHYCCIIVHAFVRVTDG